jgi:hypothetical protein
MRHAVDYLPIPMHSLNPTHMPTNHSIIEYMGYKIISAAGAADE